MNFSSAKGLYIVGNAVSLSDGRKAIITGYGPYENQYWCEVYCNGSVNLGSADYFCTYGTNPVIVSLLPSEEAAIIASALKDELQRLVSKYGPSCAAVFCRRYGPISHIYG